MHFLKAFVIGFSLISVSTGALTTYALDLPDSHVLTVESIVFEEGFYPGGRINLNARAMRLRMKPQRDPLAKIGWIAQRRSAKIGKWFETSGPNWHWLPETITILGFPLCLKVSEGCALSFARLTEVVEDCHYLRWGNRRRLELFQDEFPQKPKAEVKTRLSWNSKKAPFGIPKARVFDSSLDDSCREIDIDFTIGDAWTTHKVEAMASNVLLDVDHRAEINAQMPLPKWQVNVLRQHYVCFDFERLEFDPSRSSKSYANPNGSSCVYVDPERNSVSLGWDAAGYVFGKLHYRVQSIPQ